MKKIVMILLALIPSLLFGQLERTLQKTIELKMPGKVFTSVNTGADSIPGTRGAAVAWHPVQKKYYAAFAGNYSYPFGVFDAKGTLLSDDEQTCLEDTRGIWYNTKTKKLCGNGFSEIGWFSYILNAKGIPTEITIDAEGMNQPYDQCIGVFNPKSNLVYFLSGQFVYAYTEDRMPEEDSSIRLYPGISRKENIPAEDDGAVLSEDYNYNGLIYTGIPKAELGLLNVVNKQVELYNKKTGLMTQILKLPEDLELWKGFNFSYANGIYWIFDQGARKWVGFK